MGLSKSNFISLRIARIGLFIPWMLCPMSRSDPIFLVVARNEVNIAAQGSAAGSAQYEAKFEMGRRSFTGTIAPESFNKFQGWKLGKNVKG